jgi:hypothetical protein
MSENLEYALIALVKALTVLVNKAVEQIDKDVE